MSDTPRTDALREVIVGQYKEDELTGNGMGNILAALPDIESLERERDEWAERWADLSRASVNDICAQRERDAERALADRLAEALKFIATDKIANANDMRFRANKALTAWKEARSDERDQLSKQLDFERALAERLEQENADIFLDMWSKAQERAIDAERALKEAWYIMDTIEGNDAVDEWQNKYSKYIESDHHSCANVFFAILDNEEAPYCVVDGDSRDCYTDSGDAIKALQKRMRTITEETYTSCPDCDALASHGVNDGPCEAHKL